MSTPALDIRGLSKSFGSSPIIRNLSLDVHTGERHAIIGPNGAGKSTLFNLISGMYTPSSGSIRLNGTDIAGLPAHEINRLKLARSFQITNVFPKLSVFENIRIGILGRMGYRFSVTRPASALEAVNAQTLALVQRVRLQAQMDHPAGELTYSEQRALEIGMTLSTGAEVILLDEPTAGMSTDEAAYAVELVRDVAHGKTLLIVEHDMDVVFSLCDRISVLVYGEILATGRPDEIRANRAVQEAYLGETR
jgi:branched-chain amino acid transport system ATP-binding protein